MYLKEPIKKKRISTKSQSPFPINFDSKNGWIVYTAHLCTSGASIIDPEEMIAVHSMGYFGKGALSRNFPEFGKRGFGAPPIVRDRQWKRREQWLEELTKLHSQSFPFVVEDHANNLLVNNINEKLSGHSFNDNSKDIIIDEPMEISTVVENNCNSNATVHNKIVADSCEIIEKIVDIDEVVLDSIEDEVCEIIDKTEMNSDETDVLNNEKINLPLQCDEYFNRAENLSEIKYKIMQNETLVLPDSDSDTENYLTNVKPKIETEGFLITEWLQLTFEETFFLMYALGCLQLITFDGKLFSIVEAWNYFNEQDKYFLPRYIVYHYYRSKGWIVKPGIKYGGDFLLYKQGPPFYHASYVVTVETVDGHSLVRDSNRSTRNLTWNSLLHMNRLCEITAKEYLIAQVLWPSTISLQSNSIPLEALSEFTVRELLWRRWKPNEIHGLVTLDEDEDTDDEDSS